MAKINEVLNLLIPQGGYIATGEDYEGIEFLECEPITKAQFEAGFAKADKYKIDEAKAKETAKAALLAKLGISSEEAALLLS
jgi:hypothetical protein